MRFVPLSFLSLPLCLLGGCSPQSRAAVQDDHGHSHAEAVQFTLWTADYELFVEYAIPVQGEAFEFVTHVSELPTGEPRRSGPALFRLTSPDGRTTEHTEEAPARDGIYLPHITFDAVGKWRVELELTGADGARVVRFPTVRVYADDHSAAHASVPHPPDGISFLKEQQWRLGTKIAALEPRRMVERIDVPGMVHAAQERQAIVTAPVSGRLETPAGQPFPHLGTRVEQGEILGFVRPPFSDFLARVQTAESEIVRAQLAVERSQLVLDRVEKLHAKQARSESDLEKARFDVQLALADYTAAESVAQALRTSGLQTSPQGEVRFALPSPIAGAVVEVEAVNGGFVEAGTHLIHVRDSSIVHLEAMVRPEALEGIVERERPIFVRPRGTSDAGELHLPGAKLAFVGDEIDPHTLTVPVHFEVFNPDNRLRIGELIELQFPIGQPQQSLALPTSALVEEDGEPVVFVQLSGEVFERRYPKLGFRDGAFVEVLDGVAPGERVVIEGPYAVRLASVAGDTIGHGHSH